MAPPSPLPHNGLSEQHLSVSLAAVAILLLALLFRKQLLFLWRGMNSLAAEYNQQYMDEDDPDGHKLD
jgi:hypothetical protein